MKAVASYNNVSTKAVDGLYRTSGIANNALRLSAYNLTRHWNKMIVTQAAKSLTSALIKTGVATFGLNIGRSFMYNAIRW